MVMGFAAMALTTRFLPKHVASFAWVTDDAISSGDPARLLDIATKVMVRRDIDMTDAELELFLDLGTHVHAYESSHRTRG